jgi:hypothetical protein
MIGMNGLLAVARQVTIAHVVDQDEQHIRRRGVGGPYKNESQTAKHNDALHCFFHAVPKDNAVVEPIKP